MSLLVTAACIVCTALLASARPTSRSTELDRRLLFPAQNTAAGFPSPVDDPFYKAPQNISAYALGQEVRRRPTNSTFSEAASSYQIMFRSNDTQNNAIGGIATVLLPKKPSAQSSLLSFQNFEDAVSLTCSPSWAYVANTNGPAQLAANLEAPIVVNWALSQGYYAVIPDQEGPDSSFIAGHTEGKIVLDGIRAALNAQKLDKKTKVAFYGYSGGAHATVWAATLAQSYAPEINIVAASHGGTPVDPEHILTYLNKGPFAGFAIAGVVGVASAYPELFQYITSNLNAAGQKVFKDIVADNVCIGNVVANYVFADLFSYFNVKDPLNKPIPQKYLTKETLLQSKASQDVPAPTFPRLIYHALFDEIIPYNDTAAYIQEQCNKPGSGQIHAVTIPIAEHLTGEVFGIPVAIAFLDQAFKGTLPSVKCGTIVPAIDPNSQQAEDILGSAAAQQLRSVQSSGKLQSVAGLQHQGNNNATGALKSAGN